MPTEIIFFSTASVLQSKLGYEHATSSLIAALSPLCRYLDVTHANCYYGFSEA